MSDENLLTKKQLADNLQVTERTIYNYQKQGMPVLRMGRKIVRYDYEQVLTWIKEKGNHDNA